MATFEERVKSWVKTQGYPLEMRVAEILRSSGAFWDHGRVYDDPMTGKFREIDLVGYFDFWEKPEFCVHLVFECKHSKDKPWILFSTSGPMFTKEAYVASMPATLEASHYMAALVSNRT